MLYTLSTRFKDPNSDCSNFLFFYKDNQLDLGAYNISPNGKFSSMDNTRKFKRLEVALNKNISALNNLAHSHNVIKYPSRYTLLANLDFYNVKNLLSAELQSLLIYYKIGRIQVTSPNNY